MNEIAKVLFPADAYHGVEIAWAKRKPWLIHHLWPIQVRNAAGRIHWSAPAWGNEMKKTVLLFLLVSFYSITVFAGKAAKSKVTVDQARALVMASLTPQQRQLPKVEAEHFDDRQFPEARFLIFTVVWEGLPKGSVVAGMYTVDPYTGDVFDPNQECAEVKNKSLKALQAQVRAKLHLSQAGYQRLKTKGPLCEE